MQGINAKEHQMILNAFNKFERMAMVAKDRIAQEEDKKTREGIAELQMLYGNFLHMMNELQDCVNQYETRRRSVQSLVNKNIRRMNPAIQTRKRYLK